MIIIDLCLPLLHFVDDDDDNDNSAAAAADDDNNKIRLHMSH